MPGIRWTSAQANDGVGAQTWGACMAEASPLRIDYFTDVLCVWAYGVQARVDELKRVFGDQIDIHYRFIPLFAATGQRIGEGWEDRGGFAGFGSHVQEVASQWDHVGVHEKVWAQCAPRSSVPAHLFLKAVQLLTAGNASSPSEGASVLEEAAWRVRCAFFRDGLDISSAAVLDGVAADLGLDAAAIRASIDSGEPHAALHLDDEAKQRYMVPGSPTLILDEGRQRLYGNVSYRIIEANIRELLRDPVSGEASWC